MPLQLLPTKWCGSSNASKMAMFLRRKGFNVRREGGACEPATALKGLLLDSQGLPSPMMDHRHAFNARGKQRGGVGEVEGVVIPPHPGAHGKGGQPTDMRGLGRESA